MSNQVHIYTDGAEWVGKPYKKEFSEGFRKTTNNRMELLAVIVALEKIKLPDVEITVFSDSKYVVDAINQKWIIGWQRKYFKGVKNPDLWKRFLKIYNYKTTHFEWVKGHNNHPQNERCDFLAVKASQQKELLIDEGFETKDIINHFINSNRKDVCLKNPNFCYLCSQM